jgi:hypothetical protein
LYYCVLSFKEVFVAALLCSAETIAPLYKGGNRNRTEEKRLG